MCNIQQRTVFFRRCMHGWDSLERFLCIFTVIRKTTCWNWTSRNASMIRSEIQQRPTEEYCVVGQGGRFITPGSFVFWCYPYQSVTWWHFPFRISPLQSASLNQHILYASWSLPCLVWSKLWVSVPLVVWRGASAEAGSLVFLGGGSFLAHHTGCWKWSQRSTLHYKDTTKVCGFGGVQPALLLLGYPCLPPWGLEPQGGRQALTGGYRLAVPPLGLQNK